ncbi:MAG: tRNA (adenosine(37)-N6)-dimethylallyltransferase MiaA [Bacteroidetes bacterium]|nr:MAG: tRNA (adenosine(37)-N6)-dimethylallyltransferase MiaA [Bacteroidota bacterium]PIE87965.1 MAG: tRNA (adenosine(37)-N6)-dimethylallyltransferase MiaA [Bacteroidota bacterium]
MLTILGATATGKTSLAAHVAVRAHAEIISADSRQVYRGMDLGTGKDLDDYRVDGEPVAYHLIDIVEPGYAYNVYEFKRDFQKAFTDISERGKRVILCGGTGMYIEAVLGKYRLEKVPINKPLRVSLKDKSMEELTEMLTSMKRLHNRSDLSDRERLVRAIEIASAYREEAAVPEPEIPSVIVGVELDRATVRERITHRLHARLEEGMVEEVAALLHRGVDSERLLYYGLEYKYIVLHLLGQLSYEEMVKRLNIAIHQFAKRQMTWYRRMQRKGAVIHWVDGTLPMEERVAAVMAIWKAYGDYDG